MRRITIFLCVWVVAYCGHWKEASAFSFKVNKTKYMRIDLALTSVFEYHTRNLSFQRPAHGPTYMDLRNKLDLNVLYDHYTVGGRVDTYNFFADRAPCHSSFPNCKGVYYPEKLYLKMRFKNFDFVAGDYYLTLGRGIALAIRKVDEFAIDNTLRGARVTYDDGTIRGTVAGGFVNSNNFDPVQETILDDTNDFVFAGRIAHRFARFANVGAHYVYYRLAPQPDLSGASLKGDSLTAYSHVVGGSIGLSQLGQQLVRRLQGKKPIVSTSGTPPRSVDLYFEGNAMLQQFGVKESIGYAFYTNLTAYLFPVTLLIEGQYYKNYAKTAELRTLYRKEKSTDLPSIDNLPINNYVNPPSMENDLLDTLGDTANTRGVRARLDYAFADRKTVIYLNYMFRAGYAATVGVPFLMLHHLYGGVEHRSSLFSINLYGGWRESLNNPDWRILHVDGDFSFHFLNKHSVELRTIYWWNDKSGAIFHIADVQLAYAYSKVVSMALLYSFNNEDSTEGVAHHNFAAEIKFQLFGYGSIKVHGGSTRGGLRCVSGVCRLFPPFEGFRTELALRF